MGMGRWPLLGLAASAVIAFANPAFAESKYDPGASDTEIKIGGTAPYSGPASAYATAGRVAVAYFQMINDQGGINGRKVNYISLDDGYNPSRTFEQVRKLVESDQVLATFNVFGSPGNNAVYKYLNERGVPHIFPGSASSKWSDPEGLPWTIGFMGTYLLEGQIFGQYLLAEKPDAKVAILYQNDELGRDSIAGLRAALGDKADAMIVAQESFETSDPTVDSQVVSLKASGADVFFNFASPKFAAQAMSKVHDIGWQPMQFLSHASVSISAVMNLVGPEKTTGVLAAIYEKQANDPTWDSDEGMQQYLQFMKDYMPDTDPNSNIIYFGYNASVAMAKVLEQCGDDLTRKSVMAQAANLKDLELPLLLPGIVVNTAPDDYAPIEQKQMARFDGKTWVTFGPVFGN